MSLLDKFRNYMLGIEEVEQESDDDGEETYMDEREVRGSRTDRNPDYTTLNSSRKRTISSESNVLSLRKAESEESKGRIVISRPLTVSEAPNISDYLKLNMISVVNLEGVEHTDAQRIADFLGGVSYALNCSIERISNDIFIIAPNQIGISNELKEEVKSSKGSAPWISAFK